MRTQHLNSAGSGDEASIMSTQPANLARLPNELLNQIFTFLDREAPSCLNLLQHPVASWTVSDHRSLKAISETCHSLRCAVLPRLFRHTIFDPLHLTAFLEFVHQANLIGTIETVVAVLHEPCYKYYHPAWWCRLHNEIRPSRLTIACDPQVYSQLAQIPMEMTDAWAFKMSYQLLELSQSAAVAQTDIDYFEGHPLPSILGAKHWSSMRVNEGSNLAAYTKYEYFLKKPPSLMSNVQTSLNVVPANANPELMHKAFGVSAPCITSIHDVLSQLEEFSYVAIFPFYNHVDQILKCIRRMTALKKLFVKLCPEPESTVLDDEIKAAEGHFDINDPWNE